ncbi:ATP-dependent protease [Vibrio parahaemolyticus]|uniref:LON peptidase substrate-binding domain-containing protein n=1 Tax=Vibrio parahaemolyticus TaxID=670 RepID=UPI00111E0F1D|nr:LON peptidase substrate-binding domain-containing protein [Vibrio parahaemolyticus]EIK4760997.1 LON peptidase substrate-binding domain-containing protein [Vibrio parahaemolyticus]EJE4674191.1 LON peptidase substrate-binding domain-containing protein [Vibrio parahaemolyticus]EJG1571748.1 LON peptidase substrate-binding domain-containing protein [Vibrio parahaemolyticus]MBE3720059.1 ATP-dependent protease [Vibrio parahaemolyticus]TOC34245.1 ATP-dependent protease [Vibrio parahaemolyticus]
MKEVMLFPLTSVVLPEGKMNLRIFEPRYKRMVKECSLQNVGFGVCLVGSEGDPKDVGNVSSIGTLVRIVDFETLSDGLLGITVAGEKRFVIKRVRADSDGLRHAEVEWLDNWQTPSQQLDFGYLSQQLAQVYEQFPQLGTLYQHRFYDDPIWVTQRWLELLPLDSHLFESLVGAQDCCPALRFLNQAIEAPSNKEARI